METPFTGPGADADVAGRAESEPTVAVVDALPEFADAFAFERFNAMQAATLPALLDREDNVVVSAPTASGKTAIAEVAICETLRTGGTALFLAPLRALTNEKESEWERFEDMGYTVEVVTGERDLDPARAERADVLVMTPEKADSATRKRDTTRYGFVAEVDCVVIDEVHLLDSDRRGSVLEVTVSRLRRLCDPRVVALSATMRNVEQVAAWLDAPADATFEFGEEHRPVPLSADVETYTHGDNAFADKYRRLYRALDLVEPHVREDGQALVFVSSRLDTKRAAEAAREELADRDVPLGARGEYDVHTDATAFDDDALGECVIDGVGFHHAGLSRADRNRVEAWFREDRIQVLFSTSTLAWGVNLPARCVVIRDTKLHDPLEGEVDMSPLDVLQMLGRAGRPGYDDRGYAWVVCDGADAERYRRLLREGTDIESRLAEDLDAHLNAEVALGSLSSVGDAAAWLRTTFYYQRVRGQAGGDPDLDATVRETLSGLVDRGFVEMDGDAVRGTRLGQLASKFYLRLETASRFAETARRAADGPGLTPEDVLRTVARAAEFDSVSARAAEEDAIAAVLGPPPDSAGDPDTADPLDAGERKVLSILRSAMAGTTPRELRSDAWVIQQNANRLLAALRAVAEQFAGPRAATVVRRVAARVETGVSEGAVGLTAIDGVGASRAGTLAAAGLRTPQDVLEAGVAGLEEAGLTRSVAERVLENARALPAVVVEWGDVPDVLPAGERALHEVTVRSTAGDARAGIRVTVNGREMTEKTAHVGRTTVPVALFGAETDELVLRIEVCFPDLPLAPVERTRTVRIH